MLPQGRNHNSSSETQEYCTLQAQAAGTAITTTAAQSRDVVYTVSNLIAVCVCWLNSATLSITERVS